MSDSAKPMEAAPETAAFLSALRDHFADGTFHKLTLSRPRGGPEGLLQLRARPVDLRGQRLVALVRRHATRDETETLPPARAVEAIASQLGHPFQSAILFHDGGELQLDFSRRGRPRLRRAVRPAAAPPSTAHDRAKRRPVDSAAAWLRETGVTTAEGTVRASMADKWRQINRFVEILDEALPEVPGAAFHLADFGCGRGLLTFAAHDLLRRRYGPVARTTGVELRPALVDEANAIAARCRMDGLRFLAGDIRDFPEQTLDAVVALHACDTATDYALHLGIRRRARLLIAAPCCHKEIRPQLRPPDILRPMFRHGILLGQEADMLTDSLRVLLLESCGYETRLFEFISPEHTAKNRMILARRSPRGPRPSARAEFLALKEFYGIRTQTLETLLAAENGEKGS